MASKRNGTFKKLTGPYPVVPTPLTKDFSFDGKSQGNLLEKLCDSGLSGLTLLGSSAEATYLTCGERKKILKYCIKKLDGRVSTIVGVIRWGTEQAVEEAKFAVDNGADVLMVALPQYYRTPFSQVLQHYETVVEQVNAPVLYYHYPEPTGLHLTPAQIGELFEKVDLIGIKESGFSTPEVGQHLPRFNRPVRVFSGQSFNLLAVLRMGAVGAICPTGILMPKTSIALGKAIIAKNISAAARLQDKIYDALPILSPGSNIPNRVAKSAFKTTLRFGLKIPKPPGVPHAGLKEALAACGIISCAAVRPPQPPLNDKKRDEIRRLAPKVCEL